MEARRSLEDTSALPRTLPKTLPRTWAWTLSRSLGCVLAALRAALLLFSGGPLGAALAQDGQDSGGGRNVGARALEGGRDELQRARRQELAAPADLHEAGLLAIVGDPARELLLVGEADAARIDVMAVPAVAQAAEALMEAPCGARGIAEHQPDDLGTGIGQRAPCGVPDGVGDGRGLVEHHQQPAALIMKASERLGVVGGPRHHVDAAALAAAGQRRDQLSAAICAALLYLNHSTNASAMFTKSSDDDLWLKHWYFAVDQLTTKRISADKTAALAAMGGRVKKLDKWIVGCALVSGVLSTIGGFALAASVYLLRLV